MRKRNAIAGMLVLAATLGDLHNLVALADSLHRSLG